MSIKNKNGNITNALQMKQLLAKVDDSNLKKMSIYVSYSEDIPSGEVEFNVDFTEIQIIGSEDDV